MKTLTMSALICCGLSLATVTQADVTLTDLQVGARALSFLQKPLAGELRVGIVYAPGNAESVSEAAQLQAIMDDGLKVGNVTLLPVRIKVTELAGANVDLYFLTSGMAAEGNRVALLTRQKQIPCVTVDLAQVRSGACFMGVRSKPKIEILVNRAAAASSGAAFSSVFRIMITEL